MLNAYIGYMIGCFAVGFLTKDWTFLSGAMLGSTFMITVFAFANVFGA